MPARRSGLSRRPRFFFCLSFFCFPWLYRFPGRTRKGTCASSVRSAAQQLLRIRTLFADGVICRAPFSLEDSSPFFIGLRRMRWTKVSRWIFANIRGRIGPVAFFPSYVACRIVEIITDVVTRLQSSRRFISRFRATLCFIWCDHDFQWCIPPNRTSC